MKAVGVIHLIVGAVAIVGGLVMCAMFVLASRGLRELEASSALFPNDASQLEALRAKADAAWASAPLAGLATMTFGVLLMVSAKGLLSMRPWSRGLTLGLAWLVIAWSAIMIPVDALRGNWFGGWDLGVIYWVLVVVLLMSREWKRAYAQPAPAQAPAVDLQFN